MDGNFENYLSENLFEYFDPDLPDNVFEELMTAAIEAAAADYDCHTDDGAWVDGTDYEGIASRVTEAWNESQYAALCDHADAMRDLRAGL